MHQAKNNWLDFLSYKEIANHSITTLLEEEGKVIEDFRIINNNAWQMNMQRYSTAAISSPHEDIQPSTPRTYSPLRCFSGNESDICSRGRMGGNKKNRRSSSSSSSSSAMERLIIEIEQVLAESDDILVPPLPMPTLQRMTTQKTSNIIQYPAVEEEKEAKDFKIINNNNARQIDIQRHSTIPISPLNEDIQFGATQTFSPLTCFSGNDSSIHSRGWIEKDRRNSGAMKKLIIDIEQILAESDSISTPALSTTTLQRMTTQKTSGKIRCPESYNDPSDWKDKNLAKKRSTRKKMVTKKKQKKTMIGKKTNRKAIKTTTIVDMKEYYLQEENIFPIGLQVVLGTENDILNVKHCYVIPSEKQLKTKEK